MEYPLVIKKKPVPWDVFHVNLFGDVATLISQSFTISKSKSKRIKQEKDINLLVKKAKLLKYSTLFYDNKGFYSIYKLLYLYKDHIDKGIVSDNHYFISVKNIILDFVQLTTQEIGGAEAYAVREEVLAPYRSEDISDVLKQCELYGVDHQLSVGITPLMAAAMAGNVVLIKKLLELGADKNIANSMGMMPFLIAIIECKSKKYADNMFAEVYDLVKLDITNYEKMVLIDKNKVIVLKEDSKLYWLINVIMLIIIDHIFSYAMANYIENKVIKQSNSIFEYPFSIMDVFEKISCLPDSVVTNKFKSEKDLLSFIRKHEYNSNYRYSSYLFQHIEGDQYKLSEFETFEHSRELI